MKSGFVLIAIGDVMHYDKLGTAILYTNDEAATERNGLLNTALAQSVNG